METDQTYAQSSLRRPSPNLYAKSLHLKVAAESTSPRPILRIKSSLDMYGSKNAQNSIQLAETPLCEISNRHHLTNRMLRNAWTTPFPKRSSFQVIPSLKHGMTKWLAQSVRNLGHEGGRI